MHMSDFAFAAWGYPRAALCDLSPLPRIAESTKQSCTQKLSSARTRPQVLVCFVPWRMFACALGLLPLLKAVCGFSFQVVNSSPHLWTCGDFTSSLLSGFNTLLRVYRLYLSVWTPRSTRNLSERPLGTATKCNCATLSSMLIHQCWC